MLGGAPSSSSSAKRGERPTKREREKACVGTGKASLQGGRDVVAGGWESQLVAGEREKEKEKLRCCCCQSKGRKSKRQAGSADTLKGLLLTLIIEGKKF